MVPVKHVVTGVSLVIFLFTAFFLPVSIHDATDSLIGRFLLIAFVLYAISLGPITGVAALLAVMAVFAERNRYKVQHAKKYIVARGSKQTLGEMEPRSQPATTDGHVKDVSWTGNDDVVGDMDSWSPLEHGESEDHKGVVESQSFPNEKMDAHYMQNGVAARND